MKIRLLIGCLLVVFSSCCAFGAISTIAASCTGTSSCTTTGNAIGDLEIAYAGVDLTSTAPTTAAGWTSVGTASINGTSTADSAVRMACKVATAASQASGTFTNATSLVILVFRGQKAGATASCASIVGTPSFFTSTVNTTSTTETFNAITTSNAGSWVAGFGYAPAATAGISTAPSGMTNRAASGTILGGHDTNGGVASFSSANVTLTTAGRILTGTVEIIPNLSPFVLQSASAQAASGTSVSTSSVTTHNGKAVAIGCLGSQTGVLSASDGTNTYVGVASGATVNATSAESIRWFVAANITGVAHALTCSQTGGASFMVVWAYELDNAALLSPVDVPTTAQTGGATGTSATPSFTLPATTLAHDILLFGSSCVNGCTADAASESNMNVGGDTSEVYTKTSTGTYTGSYTQGSAAFTIAGVAITADTASVTPCTLTLLGVGKC